MRFLNKVCDRSGMNIFMNVAKLERSKYRYKTLETLNYVIVIKLEYRFLKTLK